MKESKIFHTLVIGAGSGGLTVALGLASAGKDVLLIEKGYIGGDCTNYGCIPSKALIHAGDDIRTALAESRGVRDAFRHEEEKEKLEKRYSHLTIIHGEAKFLSQRTVEVDGIIYGAKNFVIATGSDPRMADIPGVPKEKILSNRTIFDQKDMSRLVIVGGGFIAIEMALAFARRGVKVAMIIRSERLGSGVRDDFTQSMESLLMEVGVDIFYNMSIERGADAGLILQSTQSESVEKFHSRNYPVTLPYSHILLALGRIPNTVGLSLDSARIFYDGAGIMTDVYGRTNVKHIYALGDVVVGNRQFTHLANHEGRGIIQSILFPFWKKKIKPIMPPSVLYDREIEFARTGLTFEEARIEYGDDAIIAEKIDFSMNDRSRTEGKEEGYIKIITKRLTLRIVGAEIVGRNAGEMINLLTLAINKKVSLYQLKNTIIPYPTRSDAIKRLADRMVIMVLQNLKSEIYWYLKKRMPLLIGVILWTCIIGAFLTWKKSTGYDNVMLLKELYSIITTTYFGPLIYIVFYAVRPLIFFPATLLTFLSGAIFGITGGFIYTMIGENLSASVAYLTGRFFGTHIPELSKSPISLDSEKTFSSILFTRFAFFPFDLVNYLSGFLRLPWFPFALATLIGIIPGALVFIIAGASIQGIDNFDLSKIHIDSTILFVSGVIFIISILLARFLKKNRKN